ncbi:MAG: dihydrolipoyl dehydrogenase [bacterium]|nr:MAG: dihydrolipoyl dehydrogenase [bacterium]
MAREYDCVVIGGGPAGYPAAIRASQLGARVALIEKGPLGGTCLNWGCIPTKTLHATAHLIESAGGAAGIGLPDRVAEPDPQALFQRKNEIVGELVSGVERLLKSRKVQVLGGHASFTGEKTVEVEGVGAVVGKRFIIASGSEEVPLPGIEFDGERILSSRDLLDLGKVPDSLCIVGGGAIGCEFASIFNAFGTDVTIVEMLPQLVATEDLQVSRYLQTFFRKKGITLHLGTKVAGATVADGAVTATLDNGRDVTTEFLLVSVGRRPYTGGLGIERMDIAADRSGVTVNRRMETSITGIYAAGDVIGGYLLAHVATREGIVAAENACGLNREIRYDAVPSTIYTLPEISHVGLTEQEAAERGLAVATGRFPFAANGKAKGLGESEGFVKWVASEKDRTLLGLHIIGPHATELLAPGILAVEHGMTVDEYTAAVFPHPTLSEALAEAADGVEGRAIHLVK